MKISESGWACFLLAFALVCVKKWEPGGNLDSLWYSAVSRNVALSGDYHHFMISPVFYPTVADHMPLTYWIEGFVMSIFGISDFVARLYPMLASMLSYIFVYLIGCEIGRARGGGDRSVANARHVGLCAVIAYLLAYGASKWNGTLMLDVPLTTYFLGGAFFFLRGLRTGGGFWLAAPFLVLGIITKGPIIGAIPLAIVLWTLWDGQWSVCKRGSFWLGLAAIVVGLAFFCLPWFNLDGLNPFSYFYEHKKGYLASDTAGWLRYFAYIEVIWTNAAPLLLLYLYSARLAFVRPFPERSLVRFCVLVPLCVAVPLSFFAVKFPHYMLPAYPFMALACSVQIARWLERWSVQVPRVVSRLAIIGVFALAFLPVPTSGGRSKETLNIVSLLKLQTPGPRVGFLGSWNDDMAIFQAFKWWGGLDLEAVSEAGMPSATVAGMSVEQPNRPPLLLSSGFVVVQRSRLPVKYMDAIYSESECILLNEIYCVLSKAPLHFELPLSKYPHQVYVREAFTK